LTTHRVEKSHVLDLLKGGEIGLIINTPTLGKVISRFGFSLRRKAMEYNIPCLTSLDTARAMLDILEDTGPMEVFSLDQYNV
jgi:carbamoyl-phosphate synthase large subunit